jgi:methanogenic corrinoid protein MtbC1
LDEIKEVIRLRDGRAPGIKVIAGGAAVSAEFASEVGADAYGRDAVDAVRQIRRLLGEGD